METVKRIVNVVGLAADLAPGAALVIVGLTIMIGFKTGYFWR